MPKMHELERRADIVSVARRLLDRDGGGQDIIHDELSNFTSNRPARADPPEALVHALADWIGSMEVREPD